MSNIFLEKLVIEISLFCVRSFKILASPHFCEIKWRATASNAVQLVLDQFFVPESFIMRQKWSRFIHSMKSAPEEKTLHLGCESVSQWTFKII